MQEKNLKTSISIGWTRLPQRPILVHFKNQIDNERALKMAIELKGRKITRGKFGTCFET